MKKMIMRLLTLLLLFFILFLCSCATMNKAECRHANWKIIGIEDGARGGDLSYLSRHRKACAKHGISPDLDLYMAGYKIGLTQFCVPARGLQLGLNGGRYNGICPKELENNFIEAYQQGHRIHQIEYQITKISDQINGQRESLIEMKDEIKATKLQIISAKTSEKERARLLKNYKILELEIEEMKTEIWQLRQHKEDQMFHLKVLRQQAGIY